MFPPGTEVSLVTANVGSVFEKPDEIMDVWISAFVKVGANARLFSRDIIQSLASELSDPKWIQPNRSVLHMTNCFQGVVNEVSKPAFVALHCQEVGGKSFGTATDHVNRFTQKLLIGFKNLGYEKFIAFVDPVLERSKFTALGSYYFVHKTIVDQIFIWNFKDAVFEPVPEQAVFDNKDLDLVPTVHKNKFTPDMTPMHRASRKGFLRTRWQITGQPDPIELINVHLFHDESNFMAMQQFPSTYTESRRNALRFTLRRIGGDYDDNCELESNEEQGAFFIFGDFNFRLDTGAVVSWLSEGSDLQETKNASGELIRQEFHKSTTATSASSEFEPRANVVLDKETRTEASRKLLTLEKKLFSIHKDTTRTFFICDLTRKKLLSHDKELEFFSKDLHEFEIEFPPSYPYSENIPEGASFGETRCPAWCDRVIFNEKAKRLVSEKLEYDLIGRNVCMGDHKVTEEGEKGEHTENFDSKHWREA